MAKRSYSYKFLTMGGRRFVQLTPERFERLHKKEQEAIIKTAEATGEDLRLWTRETWEQLGETKEIRSNAFRRAIYISEGGAVGDIYLDIGRAYSEALRESGREDLANRIGYLFNQMLENNTDMIDVFVHELPNIHSIYEERGRRYHKGRAYAKGLVRDASLTEIADVIAKYEREMLRQLHQ